MLQPRRMARCPAKEACLGRGAGGDAAGRARCTFAVSRRLGRSEGPSQGARPPARAGADDALGAHPPRVTARRLRAAAAARLGVGTREECTLQRREHQGSAPACRLAQRNAAARGGGRARAAPRRAAPEGGADARRTFQESRGTPREGADGARARRVGAARMRHETQPLGASILTSNGTHAVPPRQRDPRATRPTAGATTPCPPRAAARRPRAAAAARPGAA
jgi:hypothetical protein